MKNWLSTLILFLFGASAIGATPDNTEPEEIIAITKVAYSYEYYEEQARLWKNKTQKDRLDGNAWLNYFKAAHYANMFSDQPEKPFDTDAIVGQLPTELAQTFEFNYILYIQGQGTERFKHLLKAHTLAPERAEAFLSLVNYHVINGDWEQAKSYCERLFDAGEFSPTLLAWNYNALASVEKDAILLTHGDNDTYPAWVMQAAKGVRPDVEVINVNLLFYDEYRERIFEQLNIEQIDSSDYLEYQDMYLAVTRSLMHHSGRPVYLGTAIPDFLRKTLSDSLFLTGLAFKYSGQPFDNVAMLKNNFEKRFLLDHLKIQLEADTGSNVAARMNLHYLPALIMLHRHYDASGDQAKAIQLEAITMQVAKEGGRENEMQAYFRKKSPESADFETSISARSLDKTLVKIKNGLYAFTTEVTNEQYEAFLMDLVKNKEFELLETCKSPKTDWRSLLPGEFANLSDTKVFDNGGHPDSPRAPIQNISFEAAQAYCAWITKVYNQSTEKRKEHGKVLFRLPTEAEWELAAYGKGTSDYPWKTSKYTNEKGCYLANAYTTEEDPTCDDCSAKRISSRDGGFFPVVADAYFPNDYGLYNTSGNVAEMIQEKGIAKGGSWEDTPKNCKVTSRKEYQESSPAVGFRVFMELK